MKQYNPKTIEPKWQKIWADTQLYRALDGDPRPKYYFLTEFPYPSGAGLHMGHTREYIAGDVMARQLRMQGHNVLFPMGYDEFGLPTENYAIKMKVTPQAATAENTANFGRELRSLGLSFDWRREVHTSDPSYYRWTQWLFLQFFKAGLAYQAELPINWCPKEKTGLANEEVVDGKHERCGTPVEKKLMKQWLLKITAYADRLIDDLKTVDYSERIATQQINWIGRSEGASITFGVEGGKEAIEVFTTRPDTLFGATYLVLAPEHPLVRTLTTASHKAEVDAYTKQASQQLELTRIEDKQKTGVFTGAYAINPINNEKLPIWVADYVLMTYGTGAIMAVPAHDERDNEFARKFKLPIKVVVEPVTGTPQENPEHRRSIVAIVRDPKTNKLLSINWGPAAGGNLFVGGGLEGDEDAEETARREVQEETGYKNLKLLGRSEKIHHHYFAHSKNVARIIEATGFYFELENDEQTKTELTVEEQGKFKVEWLLLDEARQAVGDPLHHYLFDKFVDGKVYTGTGPLVGSGKFDGLEGAAAKQAIIEDLKDKKSGHGTVTYKLRDWVFSRQHYWGEPIPVIHCPKCGVVPVPDDDLPVELPKVSSYEPTDTGESPLAAISDWVNVACPKCDGPAKRETDTMPNWAGSSWYYLRYTDPHNDKVFADPQKLKYWTPVDTYLGGMEHTTLHLLYSRFWHKFLYDQGLVPTPEPYAKRRAQGIVSAADGRKMSKSLGNVVNPTDVVELYGADALRLHMMFMAPLEDSTNWNDEQINGTSRFLHRVWMLVQEFLEAQPDGQPNSVLETALIATTHRTIKKVTDDLQNLGLNTVVAALMELTNELYRLKVELPFGAAREAWAESLGVVVRLLAPLAPHIAEELWQGLGGTESVHLQPWPRYDPALIKDETMTIIVQVNGRVRASLEFATDASEEQIIEAVKANEVVSKYLEGHQIVRTIMVPHRLINFVVAPSA